VKVGLVVVAALLTACGTAPAATLPAAPAAAQAATVPAPSPATATRAVAEPVELVIPAIGAETDWLIGLRIDGDGALEVPPDTAMAGWFELGPRPGAVGPAVIAAHVDGVFARLRELGPGDEVDVRRADGTTAVFTAYRVDQYPRSAFPTERVYGDTEGPELRLITAGGSERHTDNVVAYARLTAVR
jgi:hypothetical protein